MKFSVVIPVYNVKDYLERCVQSVLAQRFSDYEVILVDDGSTDGSGALCDTLAARTPALVRVVHQENGGLGAARNTGIEHALGDYLVFVDSDDYIDAAMLGELAETLDRTGAEIVTFGFRTDRDGDTSAVFLDSLPEGKPLTLADTPELLLLLPNAWTRIYARDLFLRTGIRYPSRVWYEDIRTTPKLFAQAKRVVSVHKAYYYYVIREGSIMNSSKISRSREIIEALDDVLDYYKQSGLYARYRDELCRLAIDHIYIAASVRVLRADPTHPLLREFERYMRRHFPDFAHNRYVPQLPRAKRLVFELLRRRQYRLIQLLFRIKGN